MILSAKRVGPTGIAWGLDMTEEMLALARANAAEAGITNAHFLKGEIEDVPLPAESVDVVISNCVINLSTDKPAVFAELARVLRPGRPHRRQRHRRRGPALSPAERAERGSYVGCIAGALSKGEYERLLAGRRLRGRLGRVHARGRRRPARRDREGDEAGRRRAPEAAPARRSALRLLLAQECSPRMNW